MELISEATPLLVVVGAGGVGKTTLAAALGLTSALDGRDTLVMTFDPSLRLKDALGVGEEAREREVAVDLSGLAAVAPGVGGGAGAGEGVTTPPVPGRLEVSLLDAGRTFDRLVARYAPDDAARERILGNRFYRHLSGTLSGILEYMAVERLFEVATEGRYRQVILDTPPTRQALDFLEAPARIVGFLDSGALRIALKPWFDPAGHLRGTRRFGRLGRRLERYLDDLVGLDLLRDMAEFFQAFSPLFDGFRRRAAKVEELLRSPRTLFVLVAGAGRGAQSGHPVLRPPARRGRLSPGADRGQPRPPRLRARRRRRQTVLARRRRSRGGRARPDGLAGGPRPPGGRAAPRPPRRRRAPRRRAPSRRRAHRPSRPQRPRAGPSPPRRGTAGTAVSPTRRATPRRGFLAGGSAAEDFSRTAKRSR